MEVHLAGFGATWTAEAVVSFGPDVTVDEVVVPSPTAIVARITVPDSAAPGMRDVTVTQDGVTLTYAGAFEIASPLEVVLEGPVVQGGHVGFTLRNRDRDHPFDTRTQAAGIPTAVHFTPVPGISFVPMDAEPFRIRGFFLVDVLTPPATVDLELLSGAEPDVVRYKAPDAITIAPREPTRLNVGEPVSGTLSSQTQNFLYRVTTLPGAVMRFELQQGAGDAEFVVLAATGKQIDSHGRGNSVFVFRPDVETLFVTVEARSQTLPVPFTLLVSQAPVASVVTETEPNEGIPTAQALPELDGLIRGGVLTPEGSSSTDQDWFKVRIGAGNQKKLDVVTFGDPRTDTVVAVYKPDGTLLAESADFDYLESVRTGVLSEPGDYFVRISASQGGYFEAAHNTYSALIRLVP